MTTTGQTQWYLVGAGVHRESHSNLATCQSLQFQSKHQNEHNNACRVLRSTAVQKVLTVVKERT